MELRPRWKIRWLVIALLMLPTLVWFGYSLLHPGGKKNGEKLYRLVEVPVHAEQASPWVMQESGTKAGLRGIYSVDGKIAWASGTGGTVLKTIDGGEHWQKCAVPDGDKDGETLDFRGVQAWGATEAIVMASGPGEKSRLYKTTNGCTTWQLTDKNEDKNGFWDVLAFDYGHFDFAMDSWQAILLKAIPSWPSLARNACHGPWTWVVLYFGKGCQERRRRGAFAASNSSTYCIGQSALRTGRKEKPGKYGSLLVESEDPE